MQQSEQKLVERCLREDRQAQRHLYETYKVPLFRICLRYAASRSDAEDILQEGFVRIFKDLPSYRGDGPLGGWLRKVMVNSALQYLRRQKQLLPTVEVDALPDRPDEAHNAFDILEAGAQAEQLTRIIQQLPTGYRTVFNLYVVESFSHQEIATQLGISVSTSKTQLHKAKALLRQWLEKSMTV